MKRLRIILIIVAVACFGVALSYPIRYRLAENSNNSNMEQLAALREKNRAVTEDETSPPVETAAPEEGGAENGKPEADGQATAPGEGGTQTQEEAGGPLSEPPESDEGPQASDGAEQATIDAAETGTPGDAPDETKAVGNDAVTESDEGETPQGSTTAVPNGDETSQEPAMISRQDTAPGESPTSVPDEASATEETPGGGGPPEGPSVAAPEKASTTAETPSEGGPPEEPPTAAPEESSTTAETPSEGGPPEEPPAAAPDETGETMQTPSGGEGEAASAQPEATDASPTRAPDPTPLPTPTPTPGIMDLILGFPPTPTPTPRITPTPQDTGPTPQPTPTPNRRVYTGPLPYPMKDKVELDPQAMLPELKEIYELNHDLVGWITIPDTVIDYPVVQCEDSDFYLTHDFYGEENINGQIILDTRCDPYTPSYNLVISGHHMKNGSMFGDLPLYERKSYWEKHKILEFDTLMSRKQYVVFASFYSADYDEDEEGFRYNVDVQYDIDADQWLAEIRENQNFDTGIDVDFGDEFITLTTCNRARHRNGRFVVVCRKIREGETFE